MLIEKNEKSKRHSGHDYALFGFTPFKLAMTELENYRKHVYVIYKCSLSILSSSERYARIYLLYYLLHYFFIIIYFIMY